MHTAMGVVDTCDMLVVLPARRLLHSAHPPPARLGSGIYVSGFLVGVAATPLSLATNVLATALVAYKSWQVSPMRMRTLAVSKFGRLTSRYARRYRVMLRKYIEVGTRVSRPEKVMVLLVESGEVVHCLLWVSICISVMDSDRMFVAGLASDPDRHL